MMRIVTFRGVPWREILVAEAVVLVLSTGLASGAGATITEFSIPTANSSPQGITAGPDGALWFTESNKIGRTAAGPFTEFPLPTGGSFPRGITAGPDGALWFTEANFFIGELSKIGRITTAGAITEFPIPTAGSAPLGITAGPDGALWFTENGANQIGRITTAGAITEFALPTPNGQPWGITTGPDGALWFTEVSSNKIGRITTAGAITEFPIPTAGSAPLGITAGPDGALWFTEEYGKIGRITTAGAITEFAVPTASGNLWAITAGPDGALWFTEANSNKIGQITTSGAVTEFPIPTADSAPLGIAAGADGALWFTESNSSKLGRITTGTAPILHGTRFVATTGNDTGNTCLASGAPCRTIIRALGQAAANDTISVAAGTYNLALGETFPLNINTNLSLTGAGAGSTILDATGANQRVITINSGVTATITGVTITGGHAPCTNSLGSLRCDASGGGLLNSGTLTITNSTVSGNTVSCSISGTGGSCAASGGGLLNDGGSVTLTNSTVSGNTVSCTSSGAVQCSAEGGGVYNLGTLPSFVALTNSTVSGNTASCTTDRRCQVQGGGIFTTGFTPSLVTLTNSTVSGNTVSCTGPCSALGGGLMMYGPLTLTNSTVSGNTVSSSNPSFASGGGLAGDNATLTNTIIANSLSGGNCLGTPSSLGHNLSSDASCGFAGPGDLNSTDPLLGPLQNNGGPTLTHALLPGSPAIDTGTNTGCPATDQRGIARPQGLACDIGAFEFVSTSSPGPTGPANARQILNVATFVGPTAPPTPQQQQQTFLTTDPLLAGATYYDPADACLGVPPAGVKLFVFTLEGQLILGRNRDTGGVSSTQIGTSKYQALLATLDPGVLPPGAYTLVFWVKDCTDTDVLVSEFYAIQALSP